MYIYVYIPRMFGNDINISFASLTLSELEKVSNRKLQNINFWPKVTELSLNIAKTEFMTIGPRAI